MIIEFIYNTGTAKALANYTYIVANFFPCVNVSLTETHVREYRYKNNMLEE